VVFVRVGSHRASSKLTQALGYDPPKYFSHYHAGQLAPIPEARLAEALAIKGITRARVKDPERWHKCWELAKPE
jgi:hypothetical protein